MTLPCGASWPHCQDSQPVGPPYQPPVAMSILHRLKDHIYAIHLSLFDSRVQDASLGLYISACTPCRVCDAFDPKSLRARNPNPYFHQDQSQQSREDQSSIGSSLILEIERQSERKEFRRSHGLSVLSLWLVPQGNQVLLELAYEISWVINF